MTPLPSCYQPDDGHQRSESLLLHAEHVGGDVGEQGRLHERPLQPFPAFQQLRSLRDGVRDLQRHLQVKGR